MLGNDVVDLAEARAPRHARFDVRVFTPAERRRIAAAAEPEAARWMHWAAKESAFKAARRLDATTVFSPRRFVVALDARGCGEVRHPGGTLRVSVARRGDLVHALSWSDAEDAGVLFHAVAERGGRDPGDAARALARDDLRARTGERYEIDRRRRLPLLRGPRRGVLSLSHHGRFAAYACRLGPGAAR